jgi:hypothetical protein
MPKAKGGDDCSILEMAKKFLLWYCFDISKIFHRPGIAISGRFGLPLKFFRHTLPSVLVGGGCVSVHPPTTFNVVRLKLLLSDTSRDGRPCLGSFGSSAQEILEILGFLIEDTGPHKTLTTSFRSSNELGAWCAGPTCAGTSPTAIASLQHVPP